MLENKLDMYRISYTFMFSLQMQHAALFLYMLIDVTLNIISSIVVVRLSTHIAQKTA